MAQFPLRRRGTASSKLALTIDPEVHKEILAAASREGVSVSEWITAAAREALRSRAGFAAIADWENQYGRFTTEEMDDARHRVQAQLRAARKLRSPA